MHPQIFILIIHLGNTGPHTRLSKKSIHSTTEILAHSWRERNEQGFDIIEYYQMQDGGQDLVNSLNLVPGETDHFHGIGHGFEIGPIVDRRLEREEERQGNKGIGSISALCCQLFSIFAFLFCPTASSSSSPINQDGISTSHG